MSFYRSNRFLYKSYYDSIAENNFDIPDHESFYVRTQNYDSSTAPANETKHLASDGAANDNFGSSVAVGVNRIVVGAPGFSSNRGKVYIYSTRSQATGSPTYTEMAKLTDPNGSSGDYFGSRVAVGNGRIVVSAYNKNSNRGAVFIYDLNGNLLKTLNGSSTNDRFGFSIAVGCGRIAVGAPGVNDSSTTQSNDGKGYIYDLNGNAVRTVNIDASYVYEGGWEMGHCVAIGCGRIAFGAPTYGSGRLIVYDLSGTKDLYRGSFYNQSNNSTGNWGADVAIADGYIFAYASTFGTTGAVSRLDLNGDLSGSLVYGNGSVKIAVGSGRVVLGDGSQAVGGNVGVGTVRVYHNIGQYAIFGSSNTNYTNLPLSASLDANDNFGNSVAIGNILTSNNPGIYGTSGAKDGAKIVVGAPGDDDNGSGAGAIYIYDTPRQTHYLDILEDR